MTKPLITLDATPIPYCLLGITIACLLTACVTYPPIGTEPGVIPPKLVVNSSDNSVGWDDPSAFGPMPASLAAKGEAACSTLNTNDAQYKAIGYHPNAEGLDGKPFPLGAYYCVPKSELEPTQGISADAPTLDATQKIPTDTPKLNATQKIPTDTPKAPTSIDGWKSPANWNALNKDMTPNDVKRLLGEPISKASDGVITTWLYPIHGYVTFISGKVYNLGEPKLPNARPVNK